MLTAVRIIFPQARLAILADKFDLQLNVLDKVDVVRRQVSCCTRIMSPSLSRMPAFSKYWPTLVCAFASKVLVSRCAGLLYIYSFIDDKQLFFCYFSQHLVNVKEECGKRLA